MSISNFDPENGPRSEQERPLKHYCVECRFSTDIIGYLHIEAASIDRAYSQAVHQEGVLEVLHVGRRSMDGLQVPDPNPEGLKPYTLWVADGGGEWVYQCTAKDEDHAIEQARAAEGEDIEIIEIKERLVDEDHYRDPGEGTRFVEGSEDFAYRSPEAKAAAEAEAEATDEFDYEGAAEDDPPDYDALVVRFALDGQYFEVIEWVLNSPTPAVAAVEIYARLDVQEGYRFLRLLKEYEGECD